MSSVWLQGPLKQWFPKNCLYLSLTFFKNALLIKYDIYYFLLDSIVRFQFVVISFSVVFKNHFFFKADKSKKPVFDSAPTRYHEKMRPGGAQMICASFSPGGLFLATGIIRE